MINTKLKEFGFMLIRFVETQFLTLFLMNCLTFIVLTRKSRILRMDSMNLFYTIDDVNKQKFVIRNFIR